MIQEFTALLEGKYGKEITGKLLKNGCLHTAPILEGGAHLVRDQMAVLKEDLGFDFDVDIENGWAFDFPGWIGEFSPKKYMVVGMEPHIERYDFQVTYGLSEYTPQNEGRFSIVQGRKDFVDCKDDSSIIWSNLFKLLADKETDIAVREKGDKAALIDFLSQFYITDLCHFAPKGLAKRIKEIPKWTKWRRLVATRFLPDDIRLVNPELIITQGNTVFRELASALNPKIEYEERCAGVKIIFAAVGDTKIVSIPHFGSTLTDKTFWRKNLLGVREILEKRLWPAGVVG